MAGGYHYYHQELLFGHTLYNSKYLYPVFHQLCAYTPPFLIISGNSSQILLQFNKAIQLLPAKRVHNDQMSCLTAAVFCGIGAVLERRAFSPKCLRQNRDNSQVCSICLLNADDIDLFQKNKNVPKAKPVWVPLIFRVMCWEERIFKKIPAPSSAGAQDVRRRFLYASFPYCFANFLYNIIQLLFYIRFPKP